MRAIWLAAAVGILGVAPGAYAQGHAGAALTVSVRVVRSCNVAVPGATGITAQCATSVQPRTQLSSPAPAAASVPAPASTLAPVTADTQHFRVLTVNF